MKKLIPGLLKLLHAVKKSHKDESYIDFDGLSLTESKKETLKMIGYCTYIIQVIPIIVIFFILWIGLSDKVGITMVLAIVFIMYAFISLFMLSKNPNSMKGILEGIVNEGKNTQQINQLLQKYRWAHVNILKSGIVFSNRHPIWIVSFNLRQKIKIP